MNIRQLKTIEDRRIGVEKEIKKPLKAVAVYPAGLDEAQYRNCENMIGAIQIPLGIAGPLLIKEKSRENGGQEYYVPLATTEGALIASVNRGCKAITQSRGAVVDVRNIGMTRGSVFKTSGLEESVRLEKWLQTHEKKIASIAENTSRHLRFLSLFVKKAGCNVFVRFSFDTSEAMGMNMVTIAVSAISLYIGKETGAKCVTVAGNFDVDKKPSYLNMILGRGREVWAEAVLSADVIKTVLKTTPEAIHDTAIRKCLIGSAISGSLGFNGHYANIIAAIFLATGQDAAHVVEGSMGITTTELENRQLRVSIYIPSLLVGVMGGGTGLPAQKEALSVLGLQKPNQGESASEFAAVIGASVLAGELSLLSSLTEGSLASSHQKLGRGNNV